MFCFYLSFLSFVANSGRAIARPPWSIGSYYNKIRHMKTEQQWILDTYRVKDLWENDLYLYPTGVLSRRRPTRLLGPGKVSKRGSIRSFSRHSVLRLRKTLLSTTLDNPFFTCLGITLTLPWRVSVDSAEVYQKVVEDYKIAFNRWGVSFRRRFGASACVFRHELQRRKVPHCHMVCYLSDFDFPVVLKGRSASIGDFRSVVFSMWLNALNGFSYDVKLSAFHKCGVKVQSLDGNLAMFRYLCDHASKHKRSQLGYQGKQWGIINKSLLVPIKPVSYSFDSLSDKVVFYRHLGRCCRFFVPKSCVFGRKLSSAFGRRSVVFIDRSTSDVIVKALKMRRIGKGFIFGRDGLKGFYPLSKLP